MAGEEVRQLGRLTALLLAQHREHGSHALRVVSRLRHHLGPDDVRLGFRGAAELQKERVQPEAADSLDDLTGRPAAPAEHASQDPDARLREVGLGSVVRAVAKRDVRDLVSDDSGELRLRRHGLDQAPREVDRAAGKRERVDVGGIDDFER